MEIQSVPLLEHQSVAYYIPEFLTHKECKAIISKRGDNLSPINNASYRLMNTTGFADPELADTIFARIASSLPSSIQVEATDTYSHLAEMLVGTWKIKTINSYWRISQYAQEGAHFGPHRDACYEQDHQNRSFYTLMIYLQTSEQGGRTNFLKRVTTDRDEKGRLRSLPDNIIYSLQPQTGSLLSIAS
jgi:2OG-Fe(II) oxygenase superfamily